MKKGFSRITLFLLLGLMAVILACNIPGRSTKATGSTTTPNLLIPTGRIVQTTPMTAQYAQTGDASSSAATATPELQSSATLIMESTLAIPAETVHTITPGRPARIKSEILDYNSQPYADSNYTVGGDSLTTFFLERPFDASMKYLPGIDVVKAELTVDDNFDYVTVYLTGKNPDDLKPRTYYAVEIDTDYDGRGDYLIWTGLPLSDRWSSSRVEVYIDTNNDVGGKRALFSDAPFSGDGYDTKIFPKQDGSVPDLAFSRLAPDQASTVQIAFAPHLLDHPNIFMWGVVADCGLLSPGKFDYNDVYQETDAGSPLKDSRNYPLKSLHSVDNTCRMSYGRVYLSSDPGACGFGTPTPPPIPTIKIPAVTFPPLFP